MALKSNYTITKSNFLNEMRGSSLSKNEYKLFCIYLSRINPYDPDTNRVEFTLKEYGDIMQLDRPRKEELRKYAESIVEKKITLSRKDGGFDTYGLFIRFSLENDEGDWKVTLVSNPELTPYLYNQQNNFFRYKLYNTIYLDSYNQMRLYELLKQHQKWGGRTIILADLREYLGIGETDYPIWGDFSQKVLKKSQRAIAERTDITFDFEPVKKTIKGRKRVIAVKFTIGKNSNFIDQLRIEEFLKDKDRAQEQANIDNEFLEEDRFIAEMTETYESNYEVSKGATFYIDACDNEFSNEQIQVLYDLIIQVVPFAATDTDRYDYLRRKYNEMNMRKPTEKGRFAYLRKLITIDFANIEQAE